MKTSRLICFLETCQQPTGIGRAFFLPELIRLKDGTFLNLVACNADHRDLWLEQHGLPIPKRRGSIADGEPGAAAPSEPAP